MVDIREPSYAIISYPKDVLDNIEAAARTCYQSWDYVQEGSAEKLVRDMLNRTPPHLAMIEFGGDLVVRFYGDRGLSHELVRHRLASFAQISTRYCNFCRDKFGNEIACYAYPHKTLSALDFMKIHDYAKELIEILPSSKIVSSIMSNPKLFENIKKENNTIFSQRQDAAWYIVGLLQAERAYMGRIELNTPPQIARANLPINVSGEIVIKANLREWRHIFTMRASPKAHPLIRKLMTDLLKEAKGLIPVVFDDL